jgi:magnesium chelatase subunit I
MQATRPTSPAPAIHTLGELRQTGYQPRSVKDELRQNLIARLRAGQPMFGDVLGFEDTVLPELQTAILSRHNILLLGLRGQAKTRIARNLVQLLDEWMPVVLGSELNDDPLAPLSHAARSLIAEQGDQTPVAWVHRSERYTEKLATPDVSVADLIGDLDPIKAAAQKLSYNDERVIHYGLIPRSHRGIFVINELPDLQARIQVALFNILQEQDIQIRGFKLRLPLDIQFVFTANPEDYTNRGSIVTPLKDRIESQILTHYPRSIEIAEAITAQEAQLLPEQVQTVAVDPLLRRLVERIAFEARESELVDQKSGVSARLTIAALEHLVASAERRALLTQTRRTQARISDLYAAIPAITGKVELVYEGEQEGPLKVAHTLISRALKAEFIAQFPDPAKLKRSKQPNVYQAIVAWFGSGEALELLRDTPDPAYVATLESVQGLNALVLGQHPKALPEAVPLLMELVLHGLAESSQLAKQPLPLGHQFGDIVGGLMGGKNKGMTDLDLDDLDDDDLPEELRGLR